MKAYRCTCPGHDIYMEEFTDIREFIKMSDTRPENRWSEHNNPGVTDRERFLHGWDEMKDRIESELAGLDRIRTQDKKIKEKRYCRNGYYPNVGKAVRGDTRCMAKYVNTTKASKIVEVIWDPGASSSEIQETIAAQGVKLLAKIKALEIMGYRVKLFVQGFKGRPETNEIYMCRITIKEENQPLDLSRISYPLANVNMLRQWVFHWYENLPDARYIDGYGVSLYRWDGYKRKQVLDAVNIKANQYYVNLGTDIESLFNPLMKGE